MRHLNFAAVVSVACMGFVACSGSEGEAGSADGAGAGQGGLAFEPPSEAGSAALGDGGAARAGAENEPGAGAGGVGGTSNTCRAPAQLEADSLAWQALPNLGDDPDSEPDWAPHVSVDAAGRIYVAIVFSSALFAPPRRAEVYRLVDDSWELLGGEPVAVNDDAGDLRFYGVAAFADETFAIYSVGATAPRLMHSTGEGWSELALDPDYVAFTPQHLQSDAQGRPLLLTLSEDQAQVLQYGAEGFEPVGDAFDVPPLGSTPIRYGAAALACNGVAAALVWPEVFGFNGQRWQSLGELDPSAVNVRLALGPDGNPLLSWRELENNQDTIVTAWLDAQTRELQLVDGTGTFQAGASYPVPAVDNANQAYLAWRSDGAYVAQATDDTWQPFIETGNANSGQTASATLPALTLDLDGLPIVLWQGLGEGDQVAIGVARATPR